MSAPMVVTLHGHLDLPELPPATMAIAKRAGIALKVAAEVHAIDRDYFERVIRPLLDHPQVEYLGEVDDARKGELLRGASALLFPPIDWREPFGLSLIEALACGTPVIARRRGPVPAIVRDGVGGFLGETDEDLVRAVEQLDRLDRRACRKEFDAHFTVTTMVKRCAEVFERVLDSRIARKATQRAVPPSWTQSIVGAAEQASVSES